eukprot:maker-scaffold528_size145933-snap-gene-0.26 protein:Tk12224 transcript:maker-scaffold528_size145933-snap-gene-0.26-mRNA-1 annotation:"phospholipid scramblase 2"
MMDPVTNQPGFNPGYGQPMVPLNVPAGLEYLTQVDQLLVKQKVEGLEAVLGFETQNKYVIRNSMGQDVYKAKEESDCLTRMCCGNYRAFDITVKDFNDREVMRFSRPFNCCLQSMDVYSPPGTLIGSVQQEWSLCSSEFTVYDQGNSPVLQIKGPASCMAFSFCGDVEFQVLTGDGSAEIGKISKQWSGFLREGFTDADNFGISFPIDLDVRVSDDNPGEATPVGAPVVGSITEWKKFRGQAKKRVTVLRKAIQARMKAKASKQVIASKSSELEISLAEVTQWCKMIEDQIGAETPRYDVGVEAFKTLEEAREYQEAMEEEESEDESNDPSMVAKPTWDEANYIWATEQLDMSRHQLEQEVLRRGKRRTIRRILARMEDLLQTFDTLSQEKTKRFKNKDACRLKRKKLGLQRAKVQKVMVNGSGGQQMEVESGMVKIRFQTKFGDEPVKTVEAWTMLQLTKAQGKSNWEMCKNKFKHLADLPLQDVEGEPDILVGLDMIDFHKSLETRNGGSGEPFAEKTILGWVTRGKCAQVAPEKIQFHHTRLSWENDVNEFFNNEAFGSEFKGKSENDREKRIKSLEAEDQTKNGQIETIELEKKELWEKFEALQNESVLHYRGKDESISELNQKLNQFKELDSLMKERNELVKQLKFDSKSNEEEITDLTRKLEGISIFESNLTDKTQIIARMESESTDKDKQIMELNKKIQKIQELERAKDELQAKRSQVLKLSDELEVTAAQVQGLQSEVEAYQSQLKSVPALKEEIDDLIKNQDHLKHELEDLNHLEAQKEAELQVLLCRLDQSVAQLAHKDEKIVALKGRLN